MLSSTAICLPFAAFAAMMWVLRLRGEGWRSAALGAATCWGVFLAVITEALSVPRFITRPALSVVWFTLTLVALGCASVLVLRRTSVAAEPQAAGYPSRSALKKLDWFFLGGIALVLALVGATALLSAPNTWDVMAYHLSRVVQWMTNRDVNLYPTFYSVQLFLSPWSEYAMLHLDVLNGSDRLVNLVEWASMAGTVMGASLIAERLGAGVRGQIFAALACATIPEGVLEASGAMNTYVGTFWIVVAVYYLLRWNEKQSWVSIFATGSAIGLAIMTKGTAFLLLPFMLLAIWWMGSATARKRLLAGVPMMVALILALNGPSFVRNYRLSGSPLGFSSPMGNDPERQYSNSRLSASVAVGNVVKNLALHAGTPSGAFNDRITRGIASLLGAMGVDPSDKSSTWRGGFHLNSASPNESRAGNPLHLALIFLACLLLCSSRIGEKRLRLFALGMIASFVLFSAVLRWQPWNSRYHLPLFALGMALVAVVLERSGWSRWGISTAGCLLLIAAMPFALLNTMRPLVPWMSPSILHKSWTASYFADSHDAWMDSYVAATEFVRAGQCNNIGVDASLEDFDYPIFALLDAGRGDPTVRYAEVRNITSGYVRPDTQPPCTVICLRCAKAPSKWAEYRGGGGRASVFGEVVVFSGSGDAPDTRQFVILQPYHPEQIVRDIEHYRDFPRAVNMTPTEAKVAKASHEFPRKRADLKGRLNAIYVGAVTLWRVRDSVDPMRRKGETEDDSRIDPQQLMSALEIFQDWDQTISDRLAQVDGAADQLYSSWETDLVGVQQPAGGASAGCTLRVRTVESRISSAGTTPAAASSEERAVIVPECACLEKQAGSSVVLARKAFGTYDSEAENLSCIDADTSTARISLLWAPRRNNQIGLLSQ